MEAVSGFLLEILNAAASPRDDDMLLGDFLVTAVRCIHRLRGQPLPQYRRDFGLQGDSRDAELKAAEDV